MQFIFDGQHHALAHYESYNWSCTTLLRPHVIVRVAYRYMAPTHEPKEPYNHHLLCRLRNTEPGVHPSRMSLDCMPYRRCLPISLRPLTFSPVLSCTPPHHRLLLTKIKNRLYQAQHIHSVRLPTSTPYNLLFIIQIWQQVLLLGQCKQAGSSPRPI